MEKEIRCAVDTLYHCLTHFEQVDEDCLTALQQAGYSMKQIDDQLAKAGSKFLASFACSPLQVIERLRQLCPELLSNLPVPDADGRIRLSFILDEKVGTDGIVDVNTLTPAELSTMYMEERNGYVIRKVNISRTVLTGECQLVLADDDHCCHIITLYPGVKAPPLPKSGDSDPFWDTHCFVE